MRLLTISGSLRKLSTNTRFLYLLQGIAPASFLVEAFEDIGSLPHFNPDLEQAGRETAVIRFRSALQSADALVVSAPEYAHGIPGVLKNALDWVVGSGELVNKPVSIINLSSRSIYGPAQLREVLITMNALITTATMLTLELSGRSQSPGALELAPDETAELLLVFKALESLRATGDLKLKVMNPTFSTPAVKNLLNSNINENMVCFPFFIYHHSVFCLSSAKSAVPGSH